MSSGTQVDLDWAEMDSAPGSAGVSLAPKNAGPVPVPDVQTGAAYLTDEEILGLESPVSAVADRHGECVDRSQPQDSADTVARLFRGGDSPTTQQGDSTQRKSLGSEDPSYSNSQGSRGENPAGMPAWMAAAAADPRHSGEAQALWREHQEFRAAFASPEEARAVKELLPGGLRDALSLRETTQSIERIDAALFSGDARAQAEVVAEIARVNPAAFRALFAEAAKVLAGSGMGSREAGGREAGGKETRSFGGSDSSGLSDGPTLRTSREGWSTPKAAPQDFVIPSEARNLSGGVAPGGQNPQVELAAPQDAITDRRTRDTGHPSSASDGLRASESHTFDPGAYAAFERATNDAVAQDVRGSITDTLARVLPDGVAEGAARRIGEDIFQEVHRALAGDRTLSEQVAGVLHERRFGAAEQQRVAALLAGRARQIVPGVARRVIGEWTSTVLSTARSKAARQAAAASRVDIASTGGSLDSTPLRSRAAGSSREVNYTAMSDEQILGM